MSRRAPLHPLLLAHAPADAVEAEHRTRMLALLAGDSDPFARATFAPGHFTASAFVLSPERDALLLIHHRKLDRWLQPGGHVEPGDTDLLCAARREALEEVGLPDLALAADGAFDLDVHGIPAHGTEPAHEHFDVRFLFVAPTRQLRVSAEAKAARWVPLSEIGGPAADASVVRATRKLAGR